MLVYWVYSSLSCLLTSLTRPLSSLDLDVGSSAPLLHWAVKLTFLTSYWTPFLPWTSYNESLALIDFMAFSFHLAHYLGEGYWPYVPLVG